MLSSQPTARVLELTLAMQLIATQLSIGMVLKCSTEGDLGLYLRRTSQLSEDISQLETKYFWGLEGLEVLAPAS